MSRDFFSNYIVASDHSTILNLFDFAKVVPSGFIGGKQHMNLTINCSQFINIYRKNFQGFNQHT